MSPARTLLPWIGYAFCSALCLAAMVLLLIGAGERGTDEALQLTARLSFLLFLPAYAGGALHTLFGPPFAFLKNHARQFGLAFAAAQLVHIGLVAWLCIIGATPPQSTFIFFGIALFWTYFLAIASVGRLQYLLGPKVWWFVRFIGLNYIAYVFAVDFLRKSPLTDMKTAVAYFPFAILAVAGPLLRAWAFAQKIRSPMRSPVYRGR